MKNNWYSTSDIAQVFKLYENCCYICNLTDTGNKNNRIRRIEPDSMLSCPLNLNGGGRSNLPVSKVEIIAIKNVTNDEEAAENYHTAKSVTDSFDEILEEGVEYARQQVCQLAKAGQIIPDVKEVLLIKKK